MAHLRKCLTCGTEYDYCPKCGRHAGKPGWMIEFDNEVCKDIFDVVSGYKMGIKTLDDVSNIINAYGITDYSVYSESIQNVLNQLTSNTTIVVEDNVKIEPMFKAKKNKKKWYDTIEEPVVEEPVDMDIELNNDDVVATTDVFEGVSEE